VISKKEGSPGGLDTDELAGDPLLADAFKSGP
jgi:hypothetical protein